MRELAPPRDRFDVALVYAEPWATTKLSVMPLAANRLEFFGAGKRVAVNVEQHAKHLALTEYLRVGVYPSFRPR